jgi:hypothetical protein
MARSLLICSFLYLFLSGCDRPPPPPQEPPETETPSSRTERTAPKSPELSGALLQAVEDSAKQAGVPPPPTEEPEMVSEVATVGAGKKGRGYGGGVITEPVRAYFRTRENIAFQVTIPNAMKTFKAIDPNGKGPASHEEFMQKIIQENGIELPSLPDGHRYRYDPETEDLLVERPKR